MHIQFYAATILLLATVSSAGPIARLPPKPRQLVYSKLNVTTIATSPITTTPATSTVSSATSSTPVDVSRSTSSTFSSSSPISAPDLKISSSGPSVPVLLVYQTPTTTPATSTFTISSTSTNTPANVSRTTSSSLSPSSPIRAPGLKIPSSEPSGPVLLVSQTPATTPATTTFTGSSTTSTNTPANVSRTTSSSFSSSSPIRAPGLQTPSSEPPLPVLLASQTPTSKGSSPSTTMDCLTPTGTPAPATGQPVTTTSSRPGRSTSFSRKFTLPELAFISTDSFPSSSTASQQTATLTIPGTEISSSPSLSAPTQPGNSAVSTNTAVSPTSGSSSDSTPLPSILIIPMTPPGSTSTSLPPSPTRPDTFNSQDSGLTTILITSTLFPLIPVSSSNPTLEPQIFGIDQSITGPHAERPQHSTPGGYGQPKITIIPLTPAGFITVTETTTEIERITVTVTTTVH
ncbi:hypothetical protein V8E54_001966 [Elaphomyces granulatus]